jgi:hypothetical protein
MSFLIEKDESAATRLVVPFRIFKSNGTAPDTGSSASSVKLSWGGTSMATATNKISAVSAGAGEYYLLLAASEISILGNIRGWFDQGDFPQPLFTVQVVNSNPFSNFSNIAAKAYSGVTVGAGDYAAKDMSSALTVGAGIAAPSKLTVQLQFLDYSSAVTVGAGIAAPSKVTVQLQSIDYSSKVTVGAGSYAAVDMSSALTVGVGIATPSLVTVRLSAMDYSSLVTVGAGIAAPSKVTVQLQSLDYSSKVTVGAGSYAAADMSSALTVGVGKMKAAVIDNTIFAANAIDNVAVKPATYSGVTVGAGDYAAKDMTSKLTVGTGSIAAGTYSAVTIQGLSSVQSADVQQILGSAPYALRLGSHLSSVVTGKVVAGVSLTTSFTADVSCTTNDNYNGRVLIFTDPGTSGLYGQATSINSVGGFVGFSNTSSLFNVAALTNAPPANSTFLIV